MHASAELKLSKLGLSLLILIALAFGAGHIRSELVLSLMGAIFLALSGYCFLMVLLLALINRKRARSVSARIITGALNPGKDAEFLLTREGPQKGRFFRLPALLVRYEILLNTKDGRIIHHIFDPDLLKNNPGSFPVRERGAYYSLWDKLSICDTLGLFRFSFRLYQDKSPRLLAAPLLPEDAVPFKVRSGGDEQRREPRFLRTDDLTDHRPYVPGDDPRRINWKLYGHAGDLFVREGEPKPPPHSRLIIMVDAQTDGTLFSPEAGRRGVDLLCENALAAALEYSARGMDIGIGYTGGILRDGGPTELASALAWPAALPLAPSRRGRARAPADPAPPDYPPCPGDYGLLILALPRSTAEPGALDRYLKTRPPNQETDLIFLYRGEELDAPAETCAALYGQRPGVHARRIRL